MKKAGKIKYVLTAMMLMLLLSVPGCISEDCPECYEAETGTLVLSLKSRGAATRAGSPYESTNDDQIATARVIVFVGNAVEHNQVYTPGDLGPTEDAIRITLATGTKTVYVVANESSSLTSQLNLINSVTQLEQLIIEEIDSELSYPFAMAGKLEDVELEAGLTPYTVTLTRAAAKINIQLKKGVDEDVTISRISLLSNTGKTPLWEGGVTIAESDQTWWNYSTTFENHGLTNSLWDAVTVYVYENLRDDEDNIDNATQLEIEGTFNGLPATYRVYVNENVDDDNPTPGNPSSSETNPDDHFYNIKRNHVYNITGTISGLGQFDGITIYTDVEEWVPVEKDYFVGYGYTVEVDGTTVTVSNHDDDCPPHTVKLVALGGLTFTEAPAGDTKIFEETGANDTATFTLSAKPTSGNYLRVYYNDVEVHTFTK